MNNNKGEAYHLILDSKTKQNKLIELLKLEKNHLYNRINE